MLTNISTIIKKFVHLNVGGIKKVVIVEDIFNYTDYRDFIKDFYLEKKKVAPYYSYRYISSRVGFAASFLARLFNKEAHISIGKISPFADVMKLEGRERAYFEELVRFCKAKNRDEIQKIFDRMQAIRGLEFRTVVDDEMEFFGKTYHMCMRSLLGIYRFNGSDYRTLASMMVPKITVAEAKESVSLLERLGMIIRDENGFYCVTEQYLSTGKKWSDLAIHKYQKENIELSTRALDKLPKNVRDISTVTFCVNEKMLPVLKERLAAFREEMLRFSEEFDDDDTVMHLNLQLFPTAKVNRGK